MTEEVPFPEMNEEEVKREITVFSGNITKEEVSNRSKMAIDMVNNGNIDAVDMYIKTRALKEVCDEILEGTREKVVNKMYTLHPSDRKFHGVELQLSEGSIKYAFDHDAKWQDLKDKLDQAQRNIKAYEKLMINAIEYAEVFDKDGDQVEPARVSGGTGSILKVVIPK